MTTAAPFVECNTRTSVDDPDLQAKGREIASGQQAQV